MIFAKGRTAIATPRKSLERHANEGTKPHYPVEDSTSRFAAGRPAIPAHLKGPARAEFKRAVGLLEKRQTLTEADRASLEIYATVFARWLQAKAQIGDTLLVESTFVDKLGVEHTTSIVNPLLAVVQNCEVRLAGFIKELGLSPSSRERTKLTKSTKTPTGESMAEGHPELFGLAPLAEKTPIPFTIPALEMRTNDDDDKNEQA